MEKVFEYIKKEWAVLKTAPFSFVGLAVLSVLAGTALAGWHYAERISTIQAQASMKDSEIARYRVALGIDPASKGALIELNNQELQAKASATVVKLREMCFLLESKQSALDAQFRTAKIDDKGKFERQLAIHKDLSQQFARNLRGDSFNIDNELRRRLGPQAVAAIVGITPSIISDDGTRLDLLTVLPGGSGFDVSFTCTLADGIEQMYKLLPPDFRRP